MFSLSLTNTESETYPNNIMMMKRAGLSKHIHQHQHLPTRATKATGFHNQLFRARRRCLQKVHLPVFQQREKFCVISSRSFNLSTLPSHLNIEEFPTLIIPTQPKSGQLLQNQLANRLNLNFVKIIDLGKGNCGLLPIHSLVWSFF